jgi:hypothetical protein
MNHVTQRPARPDTDTHTVACTFIVHPFQPFHPFRYDDDDFDDEEDGNGGGTPREVTEEDYAEKKKEARAAAVRGYKFKAVTRFASARDVFMAYGVDMLGLTQQALDLLE